MKPLKPGDKMWPIVGVQFSEAPQLGIAAVRFEYIKYPGQKPFISDVFQLDAQGMEELAQQLAACAKRLKAGSTSNPSGLKH